MCAIVWSESAPAAPPSLSHVFWQAQVSPAAASTSGWIPFQMVHFFHGVISGWHRRSESGQW